MDEVTPKIRFGIVPGTSARMSEEELEAAGPRKSMRIAGGTSARMAEAEEKAPQKRPYGVNMQARNGTPCTMEDLMAAEAAAQYGQASRAAQAPDVSEARAQDSARRESFQRLPTNNQLSASAGNTSPRRAVPEGTNEETRTGSRSPLQTLRSLFSRTPGIEK